MATRKTVAERPPTLDPERALKALTRQLDSLQRLKNRRYDEAHPDEAEWTHLTHQIIEAAFGDPSSALRGFFGARSAGRHNIMGVGSGQLQINFQQRIEAYEALLKGLISTLRLQLPEEEAQGIYEPGQEYEFYRDLSSLVQTATRDVFIVDAYLDEQVFNLYVSKVSDAADVRILSNKIGTNVGTVARMYARNKPLALRSSADIHDRVVFLDQRGWVIGQSIKDAAKRKPTYLIELGEPLLTASRNAHNAIWAAAAVVI